MSEVLTELVKIVVIVIVAFASYAIKAYLMPYLESKMTTEQLTQAENLADTFVKAVQQTGTEKTGTEKKQIVKDALTAALSKAGIPLSDDFASDLIEAAVKGMKIAESGGALEEIEIEAATDEGKEAQS